ncbi:glycine-rich RNA-binding protein 5, mitochondrial isoform X4 [Beta vulgaris subsp. vulgaris]|uniref:glycine-rich RNA-binding protein 5, mitochondrial isoform X4 n=1 Tax=Beta vulgaris subsp. vulgaris TaxID=3555 RepID=UPI002036FB03|nr:glycine-rich RNA-binding protein 5, mitochondrial isoform X4 [Beta vulgaris subsp. vulgaris]
MGMLLKPGLSLIVSQEDQEASALSPMHLLKRHLLPSRLWMEGKHELEPLGIYTMFVNLGTLGVIKEKLLNKLDLHGRFLKVDYAADQRRTSQGPSFSGAAGYGDSFRGNDGYGTISNQSGISGNGGNYNSYGNTGYGNTGNYSNSNYSSASAGNYEGSSANINGRATYTAEGVPSIHPGGNFSMRDVSNGASGHYLPNDVRDDFKGNPEGGYGVAAAFGGSSGNGSPEFTGNFSSNGYSNGNVDSYNANYGGANSFNNRAQYNTVREDNDYWRGHNLNSDNKLNDQDETTRSYMNDNGYTNARFG